MFNGLKISEKNTRITSKLQQQKMRMLKKSKKIYNPVKIKIRINKDIDKAKTKIRITKIYKKKKKKNTRMLKKGQKKLNTYASRNYEKIKNVNKTSMN